MSRRGFQLIGPGTAWTIAMPVLPLTWSYSHALLADRHNGFRCVHLGQRMGLFIGGLAIWLVISWYLINAFRLHHEGILTADYNVPFDVAFLVLDILLLVAWVVFSERHIGNCFADSPDRSLSDLEFDIRLSVIGAAFVPVLGLPVLLALGL